MKWSRVRLLTHAPACVIVLATIATFGASVTGSFHLDDFKLFSNPVITSASGAWRVWGLLQTRPLTYFTFWLNYQLGRDNPAGYHAVNLVLHLLAVALLYKTLLRLVDHKTAWIATALFALHPIQTEPVAYVFARATVISSIFCLLSLRFWIDGRYWPSAACFALALLGKEECVTFPLFLLLIRRALAPALGMLGLSFAAGARVLLALNTLQVTGAGARAGISPVEYLSTQGTVILRYFRLLLIPYGFTFDPDIPIVRDWRAWLAWLAIVGFAAVLWKLHRQGKWFVAGLILLAPSSTIFPAADLSAERRVYLPMIAFAILAALVLKRFDSRMILIPVLVTLALLSLLRVQVWHNERSLWAEAAEKAPRKLRPRVLLSRASDTYTALAILNSAETLAPGDPRIPIEKGLRLMDANLPERAATEFEQALTLQPTDSEALNNYGVALARLGRRDEAIEKFRRVLNIKACSASALANLRALGIAYQSSCN